MDDLKAHAKSRNLVALLVAIDCECIDTDLVSDVWDEAILQCDDVCQLAVEHVEAGHNREWKPILRQAEEMRSRLNA